MSAAGATGAMTAAALALALAGCGASDAGLDTPVDGGPGGGGDAPDFRPCAVALAINPPAPEAGPSTVVRVSAEVLNVEGVLGYQWRVEREGATVDFTPAQPDGSQIDFAAPLPGTYTVILDVTGASPPCLTTVRPIGIPLPGAASQTVRLRVVAPGGAAPVLEVRREITGGANASFGILSVETGRAVSATLRGPGGVLPAYLRFAPTSAPDAVVEAFADAAGLVTARLLAQPHDVLVIPSRSSGVAPARIAGWVPASGPTPIDIGAGATVTGTVRDPSNAPLADATVTLSIDGVPSTVAVTRNDGTFQLQAATGSTAIVEVTPPAGGGLPRLSATLQGFSPAGALDIRYAAALVRRSLAGMIVRRDGAPVAGARLAVVGSLAEVGTVAAGSSAPVSATGEVRIAATADAAGALPGTLVPAAALSGVVTVAGADVAVVPLDTSDGVPAAIDAPPMESIEPFVVGSFGLELPGAILEVVPVGALAMAGVPRHQVTVGSDGRASTALASGGRYDLRFQDPRLRGGQLIVADRTAATVAGEYRLPESLQLTGTLLLGGMQPLGGALVQILCDACNGIERAKPIAEAVSDATGGFVLSVPDPGTN